MRVATASSSRSISLRMMVTICSGVLPGPHTTSGKPVRSDLHMTKLQNVSRSCLSFCRCHSPADTSLSLCGAQHPLRDSGRQTNPKANWVMRALAPSSFLPGQVDGCKVSGGLARLKEAAELAGGIIRPDAAMGHLRQEGRQLGVRPGTCNPDRSFLQRDFTTARMSSNFASNWRQLLR